MILEFQELPRDARALACPFCGSHVLIIEVRRTSCETLGFVVRCLGCPRDCAANDPEEAVKIWNTRVQP